MLSLPSLFLYMKDSDLYSRAWCDMVFEGRNRAYGAYVLRRNVGRRYRFALMVVGGAFVVMAVLVFIVGFFAQRAMNRLTEEVQHVVRLEPLRDPEERYVSTGRRARPHATPDAVEEQVPEVTDEALAKPEPPAPIGIEGPDDGAGEAETTLEDHAAEHLQASEDLPVEGPQLIPTEAVEEMPVFPGGLQALMQFLDAHCRYSDRAIRQRLEGDVEVSFIIDTAGNVVEPEITKPLHPILDQAVLQAVKEMPQWHPGTMHGKPSPTRITVPVHFQLR